MNEEAPSIPQLLKVNCNLAKRIEELEKIKEDQADALAKKFDDVCKHLLDVFYPKQAERIKELEVENKALMKRAEVAEDDVQVTKERIKEFEVEDKQLKERLEKLKIEIDRMYRRVTRRQRLKEHGIEYK